MADDAGPHLIYFGYGSNLLASRLHESCPSAVLITIARLPGFRLAFTRHSTRWGGGVADIVEAPGEEVWGALWRIPLEAARRARPPGGLAPRPTPLPPHRGHRDHARR